MKSDEACVRASVWFSSAVAYEYDERHYGSVGRYLYWIRSQLVAVIVAARLESPRSRRRTPLAIRAVERAA